MYHKQNKRAQQKRLQAYTSITTNMNQSVPDKIICCRCKIVKNKGAFSSTRQADLVDYMAGMGRNKDSFNAEVTRYIPCIECSGTNRVEFECSNCEEWKGKDEFSKAQRRSDDAICLKCAAKRDADDSDESDASNPYCCSGDEENDDIRSQISRSTFAEHHGGVRLPNSGATVYTATTNSTMSHTRTSNTTTATSTNGDDW